MRTACSSGPKGTCSRLRIPANSATCSGGFRPPSPDETGHLGRGYFAGWELHHYGSSSVPPWTRRVDPGGQGRAIDFVDGSRGWIAGDGGLLKRTIGGGACLGGSGPEGLLAEVPRRAMGEPDRPAGLIEWAVQWVCPSTLHRRHAALSRAHAGRQGDVGSQLADSLNILVPLAGCAVPRVVLPACAFLRARRNAFT